MNTILWRLILSGSVVAFAYTTPDSAQAQPYLPSDFSIVASVAPAHYTGQCPVKINFQVAVTSKKSGFASLKRDMFDDNGLNPIWQLQFAQPGTTSLSMTRNQSTSASGWEMFSLIGPVKGVTSGKVVFNVVCTNPPPAPGDPTTSFTPQPGTKSPLKYPNPSTGNVAPANQAPAAAPTSDAPARLPRSTSPQR